MSDDDMPNIGEHGASAVLYCSRPGELARIIAATATKTDSQELQEAGAAACALLLADVMGDEASLPFSQRQEVARAARQIAGQILERWEERDEAEGRPWKGEE